MADNKDITDQTKQSIRTIKSETEIGVGFIKQQSKNSKADISRTVKDAKKTVSETIREKTQLATDVVKQQQQKSTEVVKQQQQKSTDDIERTTTKNRLAFQKNIDRVVNNAVVQFDASIKDVVDESFNAIEQTASGVVNQIKKTADDSISSIKQVVNQQKQQASNQSQTAENKPAPDLTTKILQDILSEVKVLRKLTEGSIKYDTKSGRYRGAKGRYLKETDVREAAVREQDEKEKKRKGLFGSLRERFVTAKKTASPVSQGSKQIGEGAKGIATNPLVIAGLLAFLAPTEMLSFIKGFLGEILFGESANAFTQSIGAFVALWAGFKLHKAFMNILTVAKGLWNIGKFLFANPYLLLALGVVVAFAKIKADIDKKYGKRLERIGLEDELKEIQGRQYENTEQGRQQKAADEARAEQIRKRISDLSKEGVYSSQGQAVRAVRSGENTPVIEASGAVQQVVNELVKYDTAVEKQRANSPLNPLTAADKETLGLYPNRDAIFQDFGFRTPEQRAAVEDLVKKKRQPTATNRPTAAPPTTTQLSLQTPAQTDTAAPRPQQSSAASSQGLAGSASGAPTLERSMPSTGTAINETSATVESEYQQTPKDTTTVVSQDATQIPKKANVIDTIPGIVPNRSSFSMYEIFGVVPLTL